MLKIQNVNRIVGMTANGCRVVDVEYSTEKHGYFFNLVDKHELNSEGSEYFQIRLLETDEVDRYSLFVMGWHICTVMCITKDDMKGPPALASLMYTIIDKAIEAKNQY